jgi:transposase
VPLAPAVVTEHVYLARRCPRCGGRWQPGPELEGVVVGRGRLGVGLLSLVAWLWAEGRLPFAVIQAYLAQVHRLHLSQGALVGAMRTVAERGKDLVAAQLAAIRASPVVHVDETGWREDGVNGYLWTFATPERRYYVHGRRERSVVEGTLGEDFAGVLVSDFYVAYTTLADVRHQYCWAHLLRDVDEVVRQHPRDATVRGWADAVHRLYARARAVGASDPAARQQARQRCEAELSILLAPALAAPAGAEAPPHAALCRRMDKHLGELFVFVEEPAVPPTNNAAERSLRQLVTSRKISGGTRSADGTTTRTRLATLFGTWRAQGLDPLAQCRQLLAAPQV